MITLLTHYYAIITPHADILFIDIYWFIIYYMPLHYYWYFITPAIIYWLIFIDTPLILLHYASHLLRLFSHLLLFSLYFDIAIALLSYYDIIIAATLILIIDIIIYYHWLRHSRLHYYIY